ncbi:T9SS type A sorting domain-containing protein [Chryseobacterium daeguense]|uniref:T9SS type A sorting domain-containing protein n=1 Tax=Chryseobacterium daeguense TaxID=412438 RepID=UPI000404FEA8|nr:T9SS type A sorting domain-containing protein [Chryseobacterium daeguense]
MKKNQQQKSISSHFHIINKFIYVVIFISCLSFAQNNNCSNITPPNLVRNGNFEEHSNPPSNIGQLNYSCGWQDLSFMTSADYFNSDATSSVGVPSNAFGNQADKIIGNHAYAGIVVGNTYSEPLKTELTSSLQPNTKYRLSFDVSSAEYFTSNPVKMQAFITDANLNLTGVSIPSANITSDKVFLTNPSFSGPSSATTWETITFTFTTSSNSNLKYLYIGGLNNVQFQNSTNQSSYFYIDNVSLVPFSSLGLSELNIDNDNIEVFPNPADSIINITNSKSDIKSIELSDMGGRVLEVKKVNKKDIQFDISNYENGTYLIKIITKDGNTIKKFIKY